MQVSDRDQKFIELAGQQNLLNEKQAMFCEQRMRLGASPALTVLSEGYMSREQVKEISEQLGFDEAFELQVVLDDTEQRFLEKVRKSELVDEIAWKFCRMEQKRLSGLNYQIPLSTIMVGTGCLDSENAVEIYQAVLGSKTPVAVLAGENLFSESGLPQIRQFNNYLKKKKRESQAEIPAEVQLMQRLEKAVDKPKETGGKEKSLPESAEVEEVASTTEIPEALDTEAKPKIREEAIPSPKLKQPATASVERQVVTSFSEGAVESLIAGVAEVVEKSLVKFWADEKASEEPDSADRKAFKQGKRYMSQREAINLLKKGGAIDKAYISSLKMSGMELAKKISITNSCIEDLELSEITFLDKIDFEGSVFLDKAVFKKSRFQKDAMFRKTLFVDGADFSQVTFSGNAHFNSANFRRFVSYNRSGFEQKAVFSRCYFARGVKFGEVKFARGASFNDMACDHRYYMEKCHFQNEATFSNAQFSHMADFARTIFDKTAKFKGTQFAKWASFNYCTFQDDCHFNGANASGDLSFKWAKFHGLINLRTMCGERNVDFGNAKINEGATFAFLDAYFGRLFLTQGQVNGHLDSHIRKRYRTSRKEYGLLKNNFREINEYDREDWAYLMEKRAERLGMKAKGLKKVRVAIKRFFNWLALDLGCGYGTKPLNIFLTSLMALVLFAIGYFFLWYHFEPLGVRLSFWEAVLISFRTFTNAEVGGRVLFANSWVNYLMMFESFMGFFIMTVLVVTFSRKVIR